MRFSPARMLVGTVVAASVIAGGFGQSVHVQAQHAAKSTCLPDAKDGKGGPYPARMSAVCTGQKSVTVNIIADSKLPGAFSPSNITINKGTRVIWQWKSMPHNVSFCGSASSATCSAQLAFPANKGKTYSMTFNKTGTFKYQCWIHPGMNGLVVVK